MKPNTLKIVSPLVVVALGALVAWGMFVSRAKPDTVVPDAPLPLVRVQRVELQSLRLSVNSQGTVSPRTESVLVPEISGTVVEVAPSFVSGGFFESGDVLLRIDPHDYRQALIQARSRQTQAELRLAQVEAEAQVARREWEALGRGEATPLALYEPQLADARALLDAARAGVEQAERNLARTEIRAPYAGRVRAKEVDRGQFVNRGQPLARLYAVDYAEVRLPLPDQELAFIDLPLGYRGERGNAGPEVILRADFAGQRYEWNGRIVRTEGEIDPRSRMIHAVARVADPYGRGDRPDRPPLAAGLFVEAEILGHRVDSVAVLPRSALREDGRLLIVDDAQRLRFRQVEVLRTTAREVVIGNGLASGERVCLSMITTVTDGMRVSVADGGAES